MLILKQKESKNLLWAEQMTVWELHASGELQREVEPFLRGGFSPGMLPPQGSPPEKYLLHSRRLYPV